MPWNAITAVHHAQYTALYAARTTAMLHGLLMAGWLTKHLYLNGVRTVSLDLVKYNANSYWQYGESMRKHAGVGDQKQHKNNGLAMAAQNAQVIAVHTAVHTF